MKELVTQVAKDSGIEVDFKKVEATLTELKNGKSSKSAAMRKLYDLGFYVTDIKKLLGGIGVEVREQFVYNVVSGHTDIVRTKKQSGGDSVSAKIREAYNAGLEPKQIARKLFDEGIFVNTAMVYNVVAKERKKKK